MSYLHHISNLYKNQEVLLFKEVFCLEKIHGTNACICFKDNNLRFLSGGEKHENFVALFDQNFLVEKFKEIGRDDIILYGECYGGKQMGMKNTYGDKIKFIAFDVRISDAWLSVPQAEAFVKNLELEFVDYVKTSTNLKDLDFERDKDSIQAIRNGCGTGKLREGIIIRPIIELVKNNGERIIAKHKREDFIETKTPRSIVDPSKLKMLEDAKQISDEWTTKTRLLHVLDRIPNFNIENTGEVIKLMLEDIKRESNNELVWGKDVEKIIGKDTALMFKNFLKERLNFD